MQPHFFRSRIVSLTVSAVAMCVVMAPFFEMAGVMMP